MCQDDLLGGSEATPSPGSGSAAQPRVHRSPRVGEGAARYDLGFAPAPELAESHPQPEEGTFIAKVKQAALPANLTVKSLAEALGVSPAEVAKVLMQNRILATINQSIDAGTARLVAEQLEIEIADAEPEVAAPVERMLDRDQFQVDAKAGNLQTRPPVITVLGHVDHGKTSLLDAIRETSVASGEAGGITQRIGASVVERDGRKITFIDTPGHEAFTAMRARGANITDLAVLVVAADDGVMPQTIEAIKHVQNAGVPLLVAINKIDRDDANPDRVKQQLAEHGVVVEDFGGDVVSVPVSAKTGEGIGHLLEMILLVSDLGEPRANPDRPGEAVVIDSQLQRGQGPVASVLVQEGTLRVQDHFVVGALAGRIRALFDDRGHRTAEVTPGLPALVTGLPEVATSGDRLLVMDSEREARAIAEERNLAVRSGRADANRVSLAELSKQSGEVVRDLDLVIKAESQGSLEALRSALLKFSDPLVRLRLVSDGVGPISEADVDLATAANAILIGFNVRPDPGAKALADRQGIDVRTYDVVYQITEDIEKAIRGLHEPTFEEVFEGRAEVKARIRVPRVGVIAGSQVTEGKITRGSLAVVQRDGQEIHRTLVVSLRRFKDDVREVAQGYECGIDLGEYQDFAEGDILECYVVQQRNR
ncbi:MAG TPA: translation initiation factor IF-2 [Candidatus Saccharimonadales bacterium]|nr:translation initiation factor IF-2 [Candidatus Saccharimonadales bacterium]